MNFHSELFAEAPHAPIDVIVVSQVCLLRECISHCLRDSCEIRVLDACGRLDQALESLERLSPDMVLLDARFTGGAAVGAELNNAGTGAQVVAVALEESKENLLDWAKAGIADYVADTASMQDLPQLLWQIRSGRQGCASQMIGGLVRRIGRIGREKEPGASDPAASLTPREQVIQQFIGAGLSNKEIARRLDISVGTAKAHAHNILRKLHLTSRAQVAAQLFGFRAELPRS